MKFSLRNIPLDSMKVVILLMLAFNLFVLSFIMIYKSYDADEVNNIEVLDKNGDVKNTKVKEVEKSKKIENFINDIPDDKLIEEVDINKEISSVLIKEENKYESHIFNYETGQEENIDDLIIPEKKEAFYEKIKELIYLKYPSFIADVISKMDGQNVYNIKENEIVIYFYGYEIVPLVNEELLLKVNYNEVKDFINFKGNLDEVYENEDGFKIDGNKKLISITFDDGPSGLTRGLVDNLSANKVHSTFFIVTNKLDKSRDTVLYTYNHGNEIGYHSYAHKSFKKEALENILNEYNSSNELLKTITGMNFALTRPPYGAINDSVKSNLDTSFILWNVDTEDWRYKDVDYLVDYVLTHAKAGDIILFHDIHQTSVEAIKIILPELYVRGFQAVTVSELAKAYNVNLEAHGVYTNFK